MVDGGWGMVDGGWCMVAGKWEMGKTGGRLGKGKAGRKMGEKRLHRILAIVLDQTLGMRMCRIASIALITVFQDRLEITVTKSDFERIKAYIYA